MSNGGRPPIHVHFHFNIETGEIEIIVDDASPDRSEDYHDRVARAISGYLIRHPEISDAGPIRYRFNQEPQILSGGTGTTEGTDQQPAETE